MQPSFDNRRARFRELTLKHRALIYGVCYGRSRNDIELTHDMVQEVMLWIWEHLDELRIGCHPLQERAWVYWHARSVVDLVRRKQHHFESLDKIDQAAFATSDDETEHLQLLHYAIKQLPQRDQTIVNLYLEGHDFGSIGDTIGSTAEATNKQMQRIRKKIKAIIEKE